MKTSKRIKKILDDFIRENPMESPGTKDGYATMSDIVEALVSDLEKSMKRKDSLLEKYALAISLAYDGMPIMEAEKEAKLIK